LKHLATIGDAAQLDAHVGDAVEKSPCLMIQSPFFLLQQKPLSLIFDANPMVFGRFLLKTTR